MSLPEPVGRPAPSFGIRPPPPREIQLEVTGACNLRCTMCLVAYRPTLSRSEGSMSFETFRAVVDDVPGLERITLQGLGEPLLAPDLFRMIAYAAERGIRMGFNTNGTLLTRSRAVRLVRAGLGWLHISVDGATAETYESIRSGSDFDRVTRNVRGLVEAMRERSASEPELSLVFVAMRRNVRQLPDMVRLAASWGVPRLWVQNLSHSFADVSPMTDYRGIGEFTAAEALWTDRDGEVEDLFDRARRLADRLAIELRLPRLEERSTSRGSGTPGCDWPWRSTFVNHDGTVQPCCMLMGADRGVLGSVRTERFGEVWDGAGYRAFRRRLLSDQPPDVCRGCSMYRGVF
ncbi:MAG TPA: radical SAM protein [Actinomycetota bacterium]|nr:radical SAM protein [Actinomycetota bacterium]